MRRNTPGLVAEQFRHRPSRVDPRSGRCRDCESTHGTNGRAVRRFVDDAHVLRFAPRPRERDGGASRETAATNCLPDTTVTWSILNVVVPLQIPGWMGSAFRRHVYRRLPSRVYGRRFGWNVTLSFARPLSGRLGIFAGAHRERKLCSPAIRFWKLPRRLTASLPPIRTILR